LRLVLPEGGTQSAKGLHFFFSPLALLMSSYLLFHIECLLL
jgi:hypothetical protein